MGDSAAPDWGQWAQTAPTNVIPSGFVLPQRGGAPPSQGAGLLVAGPGARNQGQELCFQEFGTPNTETNTQSGVLMAAQGVQSPPLLVQNSENQERDENQEVQKSVATPSLEMGFGNPKSAQEGQVLIPLPPPTPTLQTGNSQSQNPRENSPTEFPSGDFLRPSRPIFPMSVDQNWLQTGPLDKRSYGAGFFQVRETLLGLGGLSPPLEIPNFVDFGNFFAERRPAGNFLTAPPAGNPPSMETGRLETPQPPAETPHGSRGKFQESQIVPKVPHGSDKKLQDPQVVSENSDFVIFSDGTRVEVPKNRQSPAEFPPGTQGSPNEPGEKRNLSPTPSVVSAGGKYQRVEEILVPDDMESVVGGSENSPDTPPHCPGEVLPYTQPPENVDWDQWFCERFDASMRRHIEQCENFQNNLLAAMKHQHLDFKKTVGEKLMVGLDKVAGGFSQQGNADKREILESLKGVTNMQAGYILEECKKLLGTQNEATKMQIQQQTAENFDKVAQRMQQFEGECSATFRSMLERFGNVEIGVTKFMEGVSTNFVTASQKIKAVEEQLSGLQDFCQNVVMPNEMEVDGVVGNGNSLVPPPPQPNTNPSYFSLPASSATATGSGPTQMAPRDMGQKGPPAAHTAGSGAGGPNGPTIGADAREMGFVGMAPPLPTNVNLTSTGIDCTADGHVMAEKGRGSIGMTPPLAGNVASMGIGAETEMAKAEKAEMGHGMATMTPPSMGKTAEHGLYPDGAFVPAGLNVQAPLNVPRDVPSSMPPPLPVLLESQTAPSAASPVALAHFPFPHPPTVNAIGSSHPFSHSHMTPPSHNWYPSHATPPFWPRSPPPCKSSEGTAPGGVNSKGNGLRDWVCSKHRVPLMTEFCWPNFLNAWTRPQKDKLRPKEQKTQPSRTPRFLRKLTCNLHAQANIPAVQNCKICACGGQEAKG